MHAKPPEPAVLRRFQTQRASAATVSPGFKCDGDQRCVQRAMHPDQRLQTGKGPVWTAPWQELSDVLQHWSVAVTCPLARLAGPSSFRYFVEFSVTNLRQDFCRAGVRTPPALYPSLCLPWRPQTAGAFIGGMPDALSHDTGHPHNGRGGNPVYRDWCARPWSLVLSKMQRGAPYEQAPRASGRQAGREAT